MHEEQLFQELELGDREIRRVDSLTELSILSSYQASPRQGHLEQIHHTFAYLKKKPKLTLYFDPQEAYIDPRWFEGDSQEIEMPRSRAVHLLVPPHMSMLHKQRI